MKILVSGANGQLGSEIRVAGTQYTNFQFIFTDVEELDIADIDAVRTFVSKEQFDAIINCAAYTAVDKAETDIETAYKVNCTAVENLATVCKEYGVILVHISTDYVFDGKHYTPYLESDIPNPTGVYGKSKLASEQIMQQINPKGIIIRTSWLYSSFGNNFVKTMLRLGKERNELGVVYDQIGTPTYAADLADAILTVLPKIANPNVELYHYSNEGVASWYDFAYEVFSLANLGISLNSIRTEDFPTPTERPAYSLLSKYKIKQDFKITIPYWKNSLKQCIEKLSTV